MTDLKDLLQSADWKSEKHVPVIDAPDKINKGDILNIEIYFLAAGEKFPY